MKRIASFALILGLTAACTGSTGPAGQAGKNGTNGTNGKNGTGTPSVSAVIPDHAYLSRQLHVTVSGSGTTWTDATTIDFGPGITVANLHAASPTALSADLSIEQSAKTGARDVVVSDKSGKETYAGAFTIDAPATLVFQGATAQGALAYVDLKVDDLSTPLDTTQGTDALGNPTYTNLQLTVPAGVTIQAITSATDFSMEALLSFDVDTAAGTNDLSLVSGPPGVSTNTTFPFPGALTVTARKATALTSGTPMSGNTKNPYDSALYTFAPSSASDSVLNLLATSSSSMVSPALAILPKSGHFADLLSFGASYGSLTQSTAAFYLVYWDNTGATGPYSVSASSDAIAQTVAAATGDQTQGGAAAATTFPFELSGGDLSGWTQDWVMVSTGPGDDGKTLLAATYGDPNTDILLTIYDSSGTNILDQEETLSLVTAQTTVSASSTYYVVFAQGFTWGPTTTDTTYTGVITLQ